MEKNNFYKIFFMFFICFFFFSNVCQNKESEYLKKAKYFTSEKNFEQVLVYCKKILTINDDNWVACLLAADALQRMKKYNDALRFYKRGIKLNDSSVKLWFGMGISFYFQNYLEDALGCFKMVLQLKDDFCPALSNSYIILRKLERAHEALHFCKKALVVDPDNKIAQCALSHIYLSLGKLEKGWEGWAKERYEFKGGLQNPLQAISEIDGKTILIPDCWSLGDRIQFIRFAKFIKTQGGQVLVHVPERLAALFSRCVYVDKVVIEPPDKSSYDKYITLWNLPILFNVTIDDIPKDAPYFYADPLLTYQWGKRFGVNKNFKIGICWSGSGGANGYRDVPLSMFSSIAKIPGISLYSLQKMRDCDQINYVDFNVFDFGDELDEEHGAFSDTAAIMKNLDLVITVDTSVAHLAGALGVPVWVLIPFAPDWRWFLHRTDSPWYSTMKLFRAKKGGEWGPVFEEITKALEKLLFV